jgi:hypothetical protein
VASTDEWHHRHFLHVHLQTSSDLLGNRTTSIIPSHLISTLATPPSPNPAPHLYGDLTKLTYTFPRFSHLAIQRKQKKHPGHPINSISTSDFTNLGAESSSSSSASATNQHASSIYDASQPETPPSLRPRQRRNNKAFYLACSLAVTKRQENAIRCTRSPTPMPYYYFFFQKPDLPP